MMSKEIGAVRRSVVTGMLAVFAAVSLPVAGIAQQTDPVAVTLEEALSLGWENSPAARQALGATRTAAAAERSAIGSYLPTLSASLGSSLSSTERYNPQTNTTVSGSNDSYNAGLSVGWDVFTGGRRGAQRQQATAEVLSAEADLVTQRFSVALQVERAFYDAARAEELVEVATGRIERAEEGLAAAERRLQFGSATRSDVLRSQLELNTARESLLQSETDLNSARYALGRLIGTDGPADPASVDPIEPTPLSMTAGQLADLLEEDSPTVRAAEASLRSADASVDVARTQYLPSLRLSTGYDWFNQNPALTGGNTGWALRLNMSLPVFDGFQREESVLRARVQEEVASAQLADARRNLRAEAERSIGQLDLAAARIDFAETAVEVAREDLRVQQERYNLGASTILELLQSQTSLAEAETNLVGARYDYQIARAELESLAGREL